MRVLVACEYSGRVREAFRALGFDAWSCDLLSAEDGSPYHYQCDMFEILHLDWDLMIFHPDCTYLCSSGLHWNTRIDGRAELTQQAIDFCLKGMGADIPYIAMENPIGCLSTRYRKPEQIVQPHQFGDDASKATCLWLKGLPPLKSTRLIAPRMVKGKPRWANQTDSGQNRLTPSPDRWKERSRTYQGIADAMAAQWGAHITSVEGLI